jgi:iron(III) transport system ATP-binding protein
MVFQSYALWPHMSVLENVAYPLHSKKLPREDANRRAREALALVGLERYVGSQPGNLSGGQQQRVALARALASECRRLLCDEPLSNLDVRLREQMRAEIRDLQARLRITTVYVTHDQSEALAISDHIAVMEQGSVVQFGTPREVYERPATEFVATFLGTVNLVPATVLGLRDDAGRELLELAGGARAFVAAPNGRALDKGARTQLGLRSELMRLGAPSGNAGANGTDNAWPGEIERAMFLGDSIEYVVRVPAGALKVRVPPYVRFSVGDPAVASITPEDCFVVANRP